MKYTNSEPSVRPDNYMPDLTLALNWYSQEKDKKDAKSYLKDYVAKNYTKADAKIFEKIPDSKINVTFGWISRLINNQAVKLNDQDYTKFVSYVNNLLNALKEVPEEVEDDKPTRPTVRDNMLEKVNEYLGELEGAVDDFFTAGKELDLYNDLRAKTVPQPYCPYIKEWIKKKAAEYIFVYETSDPYFKEAYSNITKRKLTQIIKLIGQWSEDIDRYTQFKKANRKPRIKKAKPPSVQVAKLKFKVEDTDIGVKSIHPADIIGASQVWIYNTKYKKLACYRTESSLGIQVKGTTLQNYDPESSEQKTLRKPKETLKAVLEAGKIPLRKILSELSTKESTANGRINEDCIILRAVK